MLAGTLVSLVFGLRNPAATHRFAAHTLAVTVVGLGAGIQLGQLLQVGSAGMVLAAAGIGLSLLCGRWLGDRLRLPRTLSLLIACGTAICGGSAIASVSAALHADADDVSPSIAVVFLLNGLALWLFPLVGHALDLSPASFGTWCALAIHDTSSVVGAAAQFGPEALQIATVGKLARALWIVPLTLGIAWQRRRQGDATRAARPPWFIAGFLAAAALVSLLPALAPAGRVVANVSRHLMILPLFLYGRGLSRATLRAVGIRPLVLAATLWCLLASASLAWIVTSAA